MEGKPIEGEASLLAGSPQASCATQQTAIAPPQLAGVPAGRAGCGLRRPPAQANSAPAAVQRSALDQSVSSISPHSTPGCHWRDAGLPIDVTQHGRRVCSFSGAHNPTNQNNIYFNGACHASIFIGLAHQSLDFATLHSMFSCKGHLILYCPGLQGAPQSMLLCKPPHVHIQV